MKVEVTALVVRNRGAVIQVEAIRDSDSDVQVRYPNSALDSYQLLDTMLAKGFNNETIGRAMRQLSNGQNVELDGAAGNLPDIGDVSVRVETKMVDWPEDLA